MKKNLVLGFLMAGLLSCPFMASAAEFGIIDSAQIFSKYNETQKTKNMLESKKASLQSELEKKKAEIKKLEDKNLELAKDIQKKRDAKKDVSGIEKQLAEIRKELVAKGGELQKFYEESQKNLYALEEKELGTLSKNLDAKVDTVLDKIAKKYKLKAVLEKRGVYWKDAKVFQDITDEVVKALNSSK